MIRQLATLVILLFTPHSQVLDINQVNLVMSPSVVIHAKVFITNPDTLETKKGMIGCSGTFIAEGTVLTAAHCFSLPTMNIWIRDANKHTYTAKLLKIDPTKDLALLGVLQTHPHTAVAVAKGVRIGEQIISVGSPFFLEFLVSEGIVAAQNVTTKPFKASYIVHTGMINPGSSGGGAFNGAGELIGVNTLTVGGFFGWAGISMAVDVKTIKEFLK